MSTPTDRVQTAVAVEQIIRDGRRAGHAVLVSDFTAIGLSAGEARRAYDRVRVGEAGNVDAAQLAGDIADAVHNNRETGDGLTPAELAEFVPRW